MSKSKSDKKYEVSSDTLDAKEKELEKEYNTLEEIKNKSAARQLEIQGKIKLIAELRETHKNGETKKQD